MNTVAVRPRLDLRYDVIQSVAPQLVGVRDGVPDAMALGEWAAKRIAPSLLTLYGADGATPVETKSFEGTGAKRSTPAGH